jgi:ribonuclease T
MNEAVLRSAIKRNPFHPFSCFDTATTCGIAFGQTVLARAVVAAGLEWDETQAHSASYDAEMTADVFCEAVNRYRDIFEVARRNEPPQS